MKQQLCVLICFLWLSGVTLPVKSAKKDETVDPCADGFTCDSVSQDTLIADPDDCTRYYQCDGGLTRKSCKDGELFDSKKSECKKSGSTGNQGICQAECPAGTGIAILYEPVGGVLVPENNWQRPDTSIDICTETVDCSVLPDNSNFPDPQNCDAFYGCLGGKLEHVQCPTTQQYDAIFGCVNPDDFTVRCHTQCPDNVGLITPRPKEDPTTAPSQVKSDEPITTTNSPSPTESEVITTTTISTPKTTTRPQVGSGWQKPDNNFEVCEDLLDCSKLSNGSAYADPQNCNFFYGCFDGKLIHMSCEESYQYDVIFGCVPVEDFSPRCHLGCPDGGGIITPAPVTTTEPTTKSVTTKPSAFVDTTIDELSTTGIKITTEQPTTSNLETIVEETTLVLTTTALPKEPTTFVDSDTTLGDTTLGDFTTLGDTTLGDTTARDSTIGETTVPVAYTPEKAFTSTVEPTVSTETDTTSRTSPSKDGSSSLRLNPCVDDITCSLLELDTIWPDPEECSNYYTCVLGQIARKDCPLGYQFDTQSFKCVLSGNAICQLPCTFSTNKASTLPAEDTTRPTTTGSASTQAQEITKASTVQPASTQDDDQTTEIHSTVELTTKRITSQDKQTSEDTNLQTSTLAPESTIVTQADTFLESTIQAITTVETPTERTDSPPTTGETTLLLTTMPNTAAQTIVLPETTTLQPTILLSTEEESTIAYTLKSETAMLQTTHQETTTVLTMLPKTSVAPTTLPESTIAPTTQSDNTITPTNQAETTLTTTTQSETTVVPTTRLETTVTPTTRPDTTIAPTTQADTTVAPTTQTETTASPTTQPETTATLTTQSETSVALATQPETMLALTTQTETTVAPTTQSEITVAPTTHSETTFARTTQTETTVAPTTQSETTVAPTTHSETTVAPTTHSETTVAPTTQSETTVAPTTHSETTVAPTTQSETTVAPTTHSETTVASTTQSETTVAPTTNSETTVAPTTQSETTVAPTTHSEVTLAMTTEPETNAAPTTQPDITVAPTTQPGTTVAPTTQPETTQDATSYPDTTNIPVATALLTTDVVHSSLQSTSAALSTGGFSSAITNSLSTELPSISSSGMDLTTTDLVLAELTTSDPNPMDPCNVPRGPCRTKEFVAIPGNCGGYLECKSGKLIVQKCADDDIFDYKRKSCLEPADKPVCLEECYSHTLRMSPLTPVEGKDLQFVCYFRASQAPFPQTFNKYKWSLNGIHISKPPPGSRIHIKEYGDISGYVISTLTFSPASRFDSGMVSCEAHYGREEVRVQEVTYDVLPLPIVSIYPLTLAIEQNLFVNITCFANSKVWVSDGIEVDTNVQEILWFRNGTQITTNPKEKISKSPYKNIEMLSVTAKEHVVYSCQAKNKAGLSAKVVSVIDIIQPVSRICEDNSDSDVDWTKTSAGNTNLQPCPGGTALGTASRACTMLATGVSWEKPNFNDCVDPPFERILDQVKRIEEGIGADNSSNYEETAKKIEIMSSVPEKLTPGNVKASTEAVAKLAQLRVVRKDVEVADEECQSVVEIISNLLDDDVSESWRSIQNDIPEGSVKLMESADVYGQTMAQQLAKKKEESGEEEDEMTVAFQARNMFLQAEYVMKDNIHDVSFPKKDSSLELLDDIDWVLSSDDEIRFDAATLRSLSGSVPGKAFALSSIYFKTLAEFLPRQNENQSVDSRILSLSLSGLQYGVELDPPVTYKLQHNMIPDDNYTAVCSFWDFEAPETPYGNWSSRGCKAIDINDTETTCECNHLTNFAILVSPVPATRIHHTILSIISLVGCVTSIVALVITIFIYTSMWKHVKSHQAVVLINLCVVLIIANLLFLIGIDKTKPEVMCTVIAVLLHYFWLVAFFLMLVEGIELVLYIIYVFHVHRKRETALLVVTAWILPLAIVAASLGITRLEGYGNEQFCWLTTDQGLLWAFVGPALFVVFVNTIIFFVVLRRICTAKIPTDGGQQKNLRHKIRTTMWNVLVITPLLGLTWVFGVISINGDLVWFQYAFCVFNSLQGLFICIFHGCCNKKVRDKMDSKTSKTRTPSNSSFWGKKGKYGKSSSTNTKRSRLKSDRTGKGNSHNGANSSGTDSHKFSDISGDGPPRFGSVASAKAASMRQLSEEQEIAMDMCSEISDSPMTNFDSGSSSGYGSTMNGHSNGAASDITHSTFVSDLSSKHHNNNNSNSTSNGTHVQKQPLTKVLSSTSC